MIEKSEYVSMNVFRKQGVTLNLPGFNSPGIYPQQKLIRFDHHSKRKYNEVLDCYLK